MQTSISRQGITKWIRTKEDASQEEAIAQKEKEGDGDAGNATASRYRRRWARQVAACVGPGTGTQATGTGVERIGAGANREQHTGEQEKFLDMLVQKLWPNVVPESMSTDAESLRTYLKPVRFGEPANSQYIQTVTTSLTNKETTLTCTLLEKEFICECSWCCKLFPLAMKQCPMCPDEQFTVTRSAGRKHGQSIM